MSKRIPNRLKFSFVSSDAAKIEGTLACSDAAWAQIFDILMDDIKESKRPTPTHSSEAGDA